MPNLVEILAAAPRGEIYIDPIKLALIFVAFICWVLFAQWTDKDTIRVNTYRQVWNMISLSVGAAALLLVVILPFVAGFSVFCVVVGAYMIAYVVHRNGLVVPEDRVCTPAHFQRIMHEGFSRKEKLLDVKERVKLTGPDRKTITPPEDQAGRQQFAFAQDLLYDALWRRTGEIQVVPAGQGSRIRLDIDGIVAERDPIARPDGDSFVAFMKRSAGLALDERRKPQKGKITAQIGTTKQEIIVKTTGSTAGETLTLHVVGPEKTMKVADVGMTEQQVTAFRNLMFGEKGMIVVTAPPGQGLTTTVYSLARTHDAFLQNIQLLEYDRELDIDNITQRTYVQSDEIPFQADLLKVFRSDPNVVVVPELREKASAVVACEGAARKQIVYTGLASADVFDGLARWIERVGDPAVVAKSLAAVTHQRLVRKLCPVCRVAYKPDPATL
ncbi:MAG: Flp pilus assembly complex ATPase component TadA, partial [Planctomycetes bacterium]|nr:Flp pilus assembly complex ATPase component TadA [Planctomycetota bacterium]